MKSKWLNKGIFLLGFLLCCYPLISSVIERQYQEDAVSTYQKAIEEKGIDAVAEMNLKAQKYNSMLYQSKHAIGILEDGILSDEYYDSLLNSSGTGVMGSLEIPKINVDLPIYHGTEDEVLSNGVGHLQGTSLPVGGKNSHCVLTGHRGLPNSKLFTRLDEIVKGDLFFLRVGNETLAYQVKNLEIVKPDEVDVLNFIPEKDLVTLITCTPYGINTHRLIVTGERVLYEKNEVEKIKPAMMSWREVLFTLLPFVFLGVGLIKIIMDRRAEKSGKNKKG